MSDLYTRHHDEKAKVKARRWVVAGVVLLAASAAWYIVRPQVVDWMAKGSLGCKLRAALIGAAVRERYPDCLPVDFCELPYTPVGVVSQAWPSRFAFWRIDEITNEDRTSTFMVVNEDLELVTSFRCIAPRISCALHDWDSDGQPELWVDSYEGITHHALIRVSEGRNELVGLVLTTVPATDRFARFAVALVSWSEPGAQGSQNMVVEQWGLIMSSGGLKRERTLASLRWTKPGGVLVPEYVTDDQCVLVWTPPEGKPYVLPPDRPLNSVLRELLPVPDGFGPRPASAPATQPATQATTQPTVP